MTSLQIGDSIYYDVARYDNDHSELYITDLWFSRTYGVVKYKRNDNKIFILDKIIHYEN